MSAIVGEAGLSPSDERALTFAEKFESEFVAQGASRRNLLETIELGWKLLETLPREDLLRLDESVWTKRGRSS
jgi:V/A-type H+-transporting ATPase subunit B